MPLPHRRVIGPPHLRDTALSGLPLPLIDRQEVETAVDPAAHVLSPFPLIPNRFPPCPPVCVPCLFKMISRSGSVPARRRKFAGIPSTGCCFFPASGQRLRLYTGGIPGVS